MKMLLLYSSREGQTKKITHYIAQKIKNSKQYAPQLTILPLTTDLTVSLLDFDVVIIGASIRYGHYSNILKTFVKNNARILNEKKTVFFGVNLIARKKEKQTPETNSYTRKFLAASPWKPNLKAVFAGALYYPRYTFWDRFMIKLIMKLTGGETDTTKEIEYTNWGSVDQFVQQIKTQLL